MFTLTNFHKLFNKIFRGSKLYQFRLISAQVTILFAHPSKQDSISQDKFDPRVSLPYLRTKNPNGLHKRGRFDGFRDPFTGRRAPRFRAKRPAERGLLTELNNAATLAHELCPSVKYPWAYQAPAELSYFASINPSPRLPQKRPTSGEKLGKLRNWN